MTYKIELSGDLEKRAKRAATRRRLSVQKFLREVVTRALQSDSAPKSGAELVEYWEREGVIGIWADRADIGDSARYARALRKQAEQRHR